MDFIKQIQISKLWKITFFYILIVTVLLLVSAPHKLLSSTIILNRVVFLVVFIIMEFIRRKITTRQYQLYNTIVIYALLTLLYNETALYNTIFFPEIDAFLLRADQWLFGFQPAVKFSEILNSFFWSELFFFGYFSYYLTPLIIIWLLYKNNSVKIESFGFVIICSFFIYYLLFILFPAGGPQFFYQQSLRSIEAKGFFGWAIQTIQRYGESPTGAFPSSHVGVSCIILFWLYQHCRKYIFYFVPVVIILVFSTVYIKAHYAIDVIAGMLTAPAVYYLSKNIYKKF